MSCDIGHRSKSDHMLLWLWHRPGGTALIQPLPGNFQYAVVVAKKRKKKKEKEKKRKEKEMQILKMVTILFKE